MSELEAEVLNWVLHDYEAPHTIATDIGRETKKQITEPQVLTALLSLTKAGLVQAFIFEANKYRPVAPETTSSEKLWFLATAAGKSHASAS